MECPNETLNIAFSVINSQRRPDRNGNAETFVQRLRAMMPRPHGDPFLIQHHGYILRVREIGDKADDGGLVIGITDNPDAGNRADFFLHFGA